MISRAFGLVRRRCRSCPMRERSREKDGRSRSIPVGPCDRIRRGLALYHRQGSRALTTVIHESGLWNRVGEVPSNYFRSIMRSESDSTTTSNTFPLEWTSCTVSFLMLLGKIGLNLGTSPFSVRRSPVYPYRNC